MVEASCLRRILGACGVAAVLLAIVCGHPAPVAAQPENAGDVAVEEGQGDSAAPKPQQSLLDWIVRTSGWIGAVLLCLSIYFVAKVVSLFLELRPERAAPPEVVEPCNKLLEARDFMGIYNTVRQDDSFFSAVVETGLKELPHGLAEARDAMERTGETLVVEMEKNISMLAVLGSLGPMIGLLGTLKGMIAAFSVIARAGAQLDASEVAAAISEALVLTFEGVALSVPAIYFYALFRNRVASISSSTMLAADEFIRRAHGLSRNKAKATGSAPGPSPT